MIVVLDNRFAVEAGAVEAVYYEEEHSGVLGRRSGRHGSRVLLSCGKDWVVKTHPHPAYAEEHVVAMAELVGGLARVAGRLFVAPRAVREVHACGVCGDGAYVSVEMCCGKAIMLDQREVPLNVLFNDAIRRINR